MAHRLVLKLRKSGPSARIEKIKDHLLTLMSLFDIVSGITDNWIWLRRVGLTDFYKPWQKRWVEWTASFSTLMVVLLSIVDKVLDAYIKARIQLREELNN